MAKQIEKSSLFQQTNLNCENVKQQIQIEKQNLKYIINLNTTVCITKTKHEKCGKKHRSIHAEDKRKEEEADKKDHKKVSEEKKCTHRKKSKHRNKEKHTFEHQNKNYAAIRRITPCCSRRICREHDDNRKKRLRSEVQGNRYRKWDRRCLRRDDVKYVKAKISKHHHHHHRKNKPPEFKIKQTESRILLSPISSLSLKDERDDVSLDDISDISLDMYVEEKPMSYNRDGDTELDTLIKRTKERERKLVEQSRQNRKPCITSTPTCQEYSSVDFPIASSDMDISINSLSTIVLKTKHDSPYSPTSSIDDLLIPIDNLLIPIEDLLIPTNDLQNPIRELKKSTGNLQSAINDFQNPIDDLKNSNKDFQCLPKSNYHEYRRSSPKQIPNTPKGSNYNVLKVKNELTTDIGTYSLESTSKITGIVANRKIVLKSEPLSSCTSLNSVKNEEVNTRSKLCKIDNIKSEFDDFDDFIDQYL